MDLLDNPFSYHHKFYPLKDYDVVKCAGEDVIRFLNGQLTNDVTLLRNDTFQGQVRLDRSGKAKAFFYLYKKQDIIYIIVDSSLKTDLIEDLDKFIIMDDISFEEIREKVVLNFHHQGKSFFGSLPCDLSFDSEVGDELYDNDFKMISLLGGEPIWGKTILSDQLVTDTVAMLDCVSLSKGCFLGQETVSKIESRRGGAYFPVVLEKLNQESLEQNSLNLNGDRIAKYIDSYGDYDVVFLKREYRVVGKELVFDNDAKRRVSYIPVWKKLDFAERAVALYEKGAELFQTNKEELAIDFMKESISLKPDFADAYESLGVIYGRNEDYGKAIELMDQLAEVDPDSVMAHTNKSLYLMKQGRIEEAEEEKAQATLKTFAMYGKEAKDKKALEKQKKQEEADLLRREQMFKQVLEIDSEDALAGYGLADIELHRNNYERAVELLEKVLESNPKYSVAYLLLGKALVKLGNDNAKDILSKGIEIASKNGDLMPANSMQEILNRLT